MIGSEVSPSTDRPGTVDNEIRRAGNESPTPSLTLTEGDYGGHGEPESSRSTLLRLATFPMGSSFVQILLSI